ncbi:IDEAL domain-containing protein [Bacillus sp. V3B]|uniref:IDEAL domain-containing protein n=1 Tax=Bacillus sp. V3B TaxID=2804915 RepID=UPI00210EFD3F|nr:IDEAL domain-containing protein [Bacillus sp. V3B]MCQ6274379.1 IDEAL domain-containing protein [Bacillus sp. V3B]
MKDNSYTELMKSSAMRKKLKENFIQDLYIEMFLVEILLKAEKDKLLVRIDQAIDERNQETFKELSNQYRELNKRFGT